jgi:hypothetical protein
MGEPQRNVIWTPRSLLTMAERLIPPTTCLWIPGRLSQSQRRRGHRLSHAQGRRRQVRSRCLQAAGDLSVLLLVRRPCRHHHQHRAIVAQKSRCTHLPGQAALVATACRRGRSEVPRRTHLPVQVLWHRSRQTTTRIGRALTRQRGGRHAAAPGTIRAKTTRLSTLTATVGLPSQPRCQRCP